MMSLETQSGHVLTTEWTDRVARGMRCMKKGKQRVDSCNTDGVDSCCAANGERQAGYQGIDEDGASGTLSLGAVLPTLPASTPSLITIPILPPLSPTWS